MEVELDTVDRLTKEIDMKKTELKLLRKQLKEAVPFQNTKFGKAYFNSLEIMTRPFARLHQFSQSMIVEGKQKKNLNLLLQIAETMSGPEDPGAAIMVEDLAAFALFNSLTPEQNTAITEQIYRLRSQADKDRVQTLLQSQGLINNVQ